MKKSLITGAALAATAILSGCNHLSSEAKKMIGDYYIPEKSQTTPILSLKGNGDCVLTAISPDVLTYSVEGEWNVENDSLVIDLNPKKITWDGDSTLIADIPTHVSYAIVSFNEINLELNHNGLTYSLHRRVATDD